MNSMGDALEDFIADIFANTLDMEEKDRLTAISDTFAYMGNQNNPPDLILKNGDAIEVKKLEHPASDIALNSSYPKDYLYSDDSRITHKCKECDGGGWNKKDIMYAIGSVSGDSLKQLCIVYGIDYAASRDTYLRIANEIKNGILEIENVEFSETKELGRVDKVDPLGITYLRIRGMWGIIHPINVFSYIYTPKKDAEFNLMVLISEEKFISMPGESRERFVAEIQSTDNLRIEKVEIKNPNNPAELKKAYLITYYR